MKMTLPSWGSAPKEAAGQANTPVNPKMSRIRRFTLISFPHPGTYS
jgi:hypothetical protein